MKAKIFIIMFLFLCVSPLVAAEEELFFTYAGPVIGFGMNKISYSGWSQDSNTRISVNKSGYFVSGGCQMDIFVRRFIGEFQLEYINNFSSGKPDVAVQHLIYTGIGKYSYQIDGTKAITGGLGAYLETPPSDKNYEGGGLIATIGTVFDITREWKIVGDVLFRYGHFGLGDKSSKLSYGAKIGVVFKVGRI
jgi:hypothetical protein